MAEKKILKTGNRKVVADKIIKLIAPDWRPVWLHIKAKSTNTGEIQIGNETELKGDQGHALAAGEDTYLKNLEDVEITLHFKGDQDNDVVTWIGKMLKG